MKKSGLIFILLLYLTSSVGFTSIVHYCGSQVADFSLLGVFGENSCSCGEGMIEGGCCSEDTYTYRVDTDHLGNTHIESSDLSIDVKILKKTQLLGDFITPFLASYKFGQRIRPKPKEQIPSRHISCIFLI